MVNYESYRMPLGDKLGLCNEWKMRLGKAISSSASLNKANGVEGFPF